MVQGHQAVTLGAVLALSLAVACSSKDAPVAAGAGGEGALAGAPDAGPELELGGAGGQSEVLPGSAGESAGGAETQPPVVVDGAFYAETVESFEPGRAGGYNEAKLPDIVLGPPRPKGGSPSLDVLSLGSGGEIVLGFGANGIADGPGPDFVVFENPFWPGGDESQVYAELGEVSVSEDGESWHAFTCDTAGDGAGHFAGCAGFTPTEQYDPQALVPLDPEKSGGDAFDLADLGLQRARFVKIRDLETLPAAGNTGGFDLDAVGVIHAER